MLDYLRGLGVVPEPPEAATPVELLLTQYGDYLVRERGLVAGSVVLRVRVARLFLGGLAASLEVALQELGPAEVTHFAWSNATSVAGAWRGPRR